MKRTLRNLKITSQKRMLQSMIGVGVLSFVFSCSDDKVSLLGTWNPDSKYYKATYEIVEESGTIKARVLYYNDDTTIYRYDGRTSHYFFSNLKEKEDKYVDAVSGATNTDSSNPNIRIINRDSLEVTTYLMNKPLKEIWIRNNN